MCERVANSRNPKTKELPSEGVSWTEIIECRLRQSSSMGAEDAYIAYVDARRRVARVYNIICRLTEREQSVLRAHFADENNAAESLTHGAQRENRERAARGRHESIDASRANLRREANDVRTSKDERDAARAKLVAIRCEARELLECAMTNYLTVARHNSGNQARLDLIEFKMKRSMRY